MGVTLSFMLDSYLALSQQGLWQRDKKANMQIVDRNVSSTAAHCRHMYRVERKKGLLLDQKHLGLDSLDKMGTALQVICQGQKK